MNYVIFLAPSEDKILETRLDSKLDSKLDYLESLWLKNNDILLNHRKNTIKIYNNYLQKIIKEDDKILLKEIFGINNFSSKNKEIMHHSLESNALANAICRYDGVAFKELNFNNLDSLAQEIILQKTYIFSNFFGVILAKDKIPYYKLKQGCKAKGLTLNEIYKPFIPILESFLTKHLNKNDDFIIDLRSSIYTKIFTPTQNHIFFEFYKNNKIVSHYSKMYRGAILRILASDFLESTSSLNTCLEFLTSLKTHNFIFSQKIIKKNKITLKYDVL